MTSENTHAHSPSFNTLIPPYCDTFTICHQLPACHPLSWYFCFIVFLSLSLFCPLASVSRLLFAAHMAHILSLLHHSRSALQFIFSFHIFVLPSLVSYLYFLSWNPPCLPSLTFHFFKYCKKPSRGWVKSPLKADTGLKQVIVDVLHHNSGCVIV